jgi:hypothetical protein
VTFFSWTDSSTLTRSKGWIGNKRGERMESETGCGEGLRETQELLYRERSPERNMKPATSDQGSLYVIADGREEQGPWDNTTETRRRTRPLRGTK